MVSWLPSTAMKMNESEYPDDILAEPGADGPRLRFAAQCADPERAALVYAQVEYARQLRALVHTPLYRCEKAAQTAFHQAQRLSDRLLQDHAARWTAQLPPGASYHFGRGCVECVTASAAWWQRHGDTVGNREPILGLTLRELTPELLAQILRSPRVASLHALALRTSHNADAAACDALIATLLANLPGGLTWLDLSTLPLHLAHHEALAQGLFRSALRWVGLPELVDFPVAGQCARPCDEAIIEEDWNHEGRLIEWQTSPLGQYLDERAGVARWRHYRPADFRYLLPPPMTLFVCESA